MGDIVCLSSSTLTIRLSDYIKKVFRALVFSKKETCQICQNIENIVFYTSIFVEWTLNRVLDNFSLKVALMVFVIAKAAFHCRDSILGINFFGAEKC